MHKRTYSALGGVLAAGMCCLLCLTPARADGPEPVSPIRPVQGPVLSINPDPIPGSLPGQITVSEPADTIRPAQGPALSVSPGSPSGIRPAQAPEVPPASLVRPEEVPPPQDPPAPDPVQEQPQPLPQAAADWNRPFYQDPETVTDPHSVTVLVNKYHMLPAGFVPQLEELGKLYGVGSMQPEAAQAFRVMADYARADGISLVSVSAYRSYDRQSTLYRSYKKQYGQAQADTFSARPGYSEHQTGLAVDVNTASSSAHFENTKAYAWLKEHCAQYGFLLRYPQGKEAITGYRFEPWHYRYVGVEIATACMEQGITYEEYLVALQADRG